MGDRSIKIIIGAIDRATGPIKKVEAAIKHLSGVTLNLGKVGAASRQVSKSIGNVTHEASKLGARLAVVGGGAGWFIKTQLIDTASQFEQYRSVLETIEGSSEKAGKSLDWVSDFAAKTPYELGEVTESFVRLRAYGINPMDGTLRTLGDTAAAMGKPVMQAVEAIADAVTGENERLKEFGIKAQKNDGRIRYEYTDRDGKTRFKEVQASNREQIRSTLMAIWNERYAGAMDKMSRTYKGMMSNLMDQWTRFKMMVMERGAFDFLKAKLEGILKKVDAMAASGQLKELADVWGKKLSAGIKAAWDAAIGFWGALKGVGAVVSWVAEKMGGYENLGKAVAALMAGKLVLSVAVLAASFVNLGVVALPAAVTALSAMIPVVATLYATLAPLLPILAVIAAGGIIGWKVGKVVNEGIGGFMGKITGLKYKGSGAIGEWAYDRSDKPWQETGAINLSKMRKTSSPQAKADVGGTIKLEIVDSPYKVKVKDMKTTNPGVNFNFDAGLLLMGH